MWLSCSIGVSITFVVLVMVRAILYVWSFEWCDVCVGQLEFGLVLRSFLFVVQDVLDDVLVQIRHASDAVDSVQFVHAWWSLCRWNIANMEDNFRCWRSVFVSCGMHYDWVSARSAKDMALYADNSCLWKLIYFATVLRHPLASDWQVDTCYDQGQRRAADKPRWWRARNVWRTSSRWSREAERPCIHYNHKC